jgi:hypothetical protein
VQTAAELEAFANHAGRADAGRLVVTDAGRERLDFRKAIAPRK